MSEQATEKLYDPNGANSVMVLVSVVTHMIHTKIAQRNHAGQAILVDGWNAQDAIRYVNNGDS